MRQHLVLAGDVGGTRSRLVAASVGGGLLAQVEGPGANLRSSGPAAFDTLAATIAEVLEQEVADPSLLRGELGILRVDAGVDAHLAARHLPQAGRREHADRGVHRIPAAARVAASIGRPASSPQRARSTPRSSPPRRSARR